MHLTLPPDQKRSENFMVFLCFQGVKKDSIGNKWVNHLGTNIVQRAKLNL